MLMDEFFCFYFFIILYLKIRTSSNFYFFIANPAFSQCMFFLPNFNLDYLELIEMRQFNYKKRIIFIRGCHPEHFFNFGINNFNFIFIYCGIHFTLNFHSPTTNPYFIYYILNCSSLFIKLDN